MKSAKEWEEELSVLTNNLIREFHGAPPDELLQEAVGGLFKRCQTDALEAAALICEMDAKVVDHANKGRHPQLDCDLIEHSSGGRCARAVRLLKEQL